MYRTPTQKRVLTVEDISCFGKCSTTVALPILSVMGHEAVILPTAILSTHTGGFTGYTVRDLTDDITPISHHFLDCKIPFDCIYTGYLCKGRQVSLVRELVARHKGEGCLFVADPAMADNGKYYIGFDEAHGSDMRDLALIADIITPNVTEAAFLLGKPALPTGYGMEEITSLLSGLRAIGCRSVVLTSVSVGDRYGIVGYDAVRDEAFSYFHKRVAAAFHGSGDIYTSVMVGKLLSGCSLQEAARFAADFVADAVANTLPYANEHPYGLLYEPLLARLALGALS